MFVKLDVLSHRCLLDLFDCLKDGFLECTFDLHLGFLIRG